MLMINKSVCVLLSTYNGEEFISQQIDSVINQEGVSVDILVRDDGSKDNTLNILKGYESRCNLKILDSNNNLGPALSFMELIYSVGNYDYYAFADQDDIWKSNKIAVAIDKIENENEPVLYCSNQIILKNGEEVGLRFTSIPNYSLVNTLCGNSLSGCTMVFNKLLKEVLCQYRVSNALLRIRMHDVWCLLVAELTGKVVYDEEAYILYRIHTNNTVGLQKKGLFEIYRRLKKRINDPDMRNGRSKTARELLLKIPNIRDSDRTILELFADYSTNLKKMYKLLMNKEVRNNCDENRILFLLKLLFRWI